MYQHWSWSQQVFQQGRIDNQVLSKEECDALLENNLNEGQAQEVNNRVRNKWLAVMRKEKKKEIIRNICNKRKQTPEEKQQINQVISEEFPQCDPSGLETDTLRIRGEQKLENDTKAVVHHSVDNPLSDHICQEAIKLSQEAPQLQQAVNREHVQQHLTQ